MLLAWMAVDDPGEGIGQIDRRIEVVQLTGFDLERRHARRIDSAPSNLSTRRPSVGAVISTPPWAHTTKPVSPRLSCQKVRASPIVDLTLAGDIF